ncbi:hypothetical protein [Lysinibacillus sp. JNUCC 51]|uniref:hypothetical protein n=1 Tax=Lysinibacillus sp. JNUCC-51 TaxID=2792479 RepID=UPI001938988F|nr:hypothetical protein JNUCC51_02270 [Lysinibacillus sp. JNUCC-51]
MNSNNKFHQADCDCQQCGNGNFNCTDKFRAIDASCIPPSIPEPTNEETVAYGSFYDPIGKDVTVVTPITSPTLGQKVIFTTPGPSLNVDPAPVPNNTTDLQVATSGVYEISMDISASLFSSSNFTTNAAVQFGLFINDSILATGSIFESNNFITTSPGDQFVDSNIITTIGKTVQLRLNKDDRLSIRVFAALGNVFYRFPSLVVTKIDN